MKLVVIVSLILNVLWFLAAFQLFSLRPRTAAKLLLKRENRSEPYKAIMTQSIKFLGGMNLALALLAILCLLDFQALLEYQWNFAIFSVFFVAHLTQFWFNLPVAVAEKKGNQSLWHVLRGTMLFIFVGDFALATINGLLSLLLLINI